MKTTTWFTLSAAALLLLAAPLTAAPEEQAAPTEPAAEHVEVPAETTCTACHAEVTPQVHDAWYAGAHGVNNVGCFVCHGSTGDDFRRAPATGTCAGCHPGQAAAGSCFTCHPPHRLSPHAGPPAGDAEEDSP